MKSTTTNKRRLMAISTLLSIALLFSCSPSGDDANTQGPRIISSSPENGVVAPIDSVVTVAFDKDVLNINNTSHALSLRRLGSATTVPAVITYTRETRTATLAPAEDLDIDTVYVVTLSEDIIDYNRNVLTGAPVTWVFTTGVESDQENPTIILQDPYVGEQKVAVDTDISVRFNETVTNVTTNTFKLSRVDTGSQIAGTVNYDSTISSAVFTPGTPLVDGVQYRVTMTGGAGGIVDISGNPLDASGLPLEWAFKTADTTPPTVTGQTPGIGAIDVPRNTKVIVEFSEQVSNVTTATFILDMGGVPVPSSVMYDTQTKKATLTPVYSELEADTEYTVTLKGGVSPDVIKDYSGNALAADVTWTFTTAVNPDLNPPVINGKSPDTGENNVAVNEPIMVEFSETVTGYDIGGFTLKLGGSSVTATFTYDDENIVTLTPQANLLEGAVYTVELTGAVKDLADNSLADTSWSFTTVDSIAPSITDKMPDSGDTDVPMNGIIILLFSEPVIGVSTSSVKLETNIGGTPVDAVVHYADIGSYDGSPQATLYPNYALDPLTEYKITVTPDIMDKSFNANPLAGENWVFTTTDAEDTTSPYVANRYPDDGNTGIELNISITAVFSEPVKGVSAGSVSLKVKDTGTVIPALVSYNPATRTVTLEPNQELMGSTDYTVTLTDGITDTSSNHNKLEYQNGDSAPVTWEFQTRIDNIEPSIIFRNPSAGAGDVDVDTKVTVVFSEEVVGVDATTFKLIKKSTSKEVAAKVEWDNAQKAWVLTPTDNLEQGMGTEYTVSLSGTIADTAKVPNFLGKGAGATWDFTTLGDTTKPVVLTGSEYPEPNAQGVDTNSFVSATFSEAVKDTIETPGMVTLRIHDGDLVDADVEYNTDNNTVTLTPKNPLAVNTLYDVTIVGGAGGIEDLAGNTMQSDRIWSFTTGDEEDVTPPEVTSRLPGPGATGVATNLAGVVVEFSEKVSNVSQSTFTLRAGVTSIQGTITYDDINRRATFAPKYNLTTGTEYTVKLSGFITDLAGNNLNAGNPVTWSFTASTTDTIKPKIISGYPSIGATGIKVRPEVSVVFSESVLNVNKNYFRLRKVSNSEFQAADITYEDSTKTATLIPRSILDDTTEYEVVLTSASITDLAANTLDLTGWTSWKFTTSTAPKLSSSLPAGGATGVSLSTKQVTLTFDKAMDPTKGNAVISGGNVTLGIPTWSEGNTKITYPINGTLDGNTQYTITYSSWWEPFCDSAGNPLRIQTVITQTKVASFSPQAYDGSSGQVRVATSVDLSTAVAGDTFVDASGNKFIITSVSNDTYWDWDVWANRKRFFIATGQSVNLNAGASIRTYVTINKFQFTTTADSVAPYALSAIPREGSTVSDDIPRIVVRFNERMNTGRTALLNGTNITSTAVWLDGAKTVSFPVSGLTPGSYTLNLTAYQDASGNALDGSPVLGDGILNFTVSDTTESNIFSYGFEVDPGNPASEFLNISGDDADWVLSASSNTPAAIPSQGSGMISANTLEWEVDDNAILELKTALNFSASSRDTITLSFDVAHDIHYPANDRVEIWVKNGAADYVHLEDYDVRRYDPYFKSVNKEIVTSFDPIDYDSGRSGGYVTVPYSVNLSQVKKGDYFKDVDGDSFAISGGIDNYNNPKKFFISIFQDPNLNAGATIYRKLWWGRHDIDLSDYKNSSSVKIRLKAISAGAIGSNILIDDLSIRGY